VRFRSRSNKSFLLVRWKLYGEVQRVDEVDQESFLLVRWRLYGEVQRVDEVDEELPRWETMMKGKGKGEDLQSRRVLVLVVIYSIVVYVHAIVAPSSRVDEGREREREKAIFDC